MKDPIPEMMRQQRRLEREVIERQLARIEAYRRHGVSTEEDIARELQLRRRLVDIEFSEKSE